MPSPNPIYKRGRKTTNKPLNQLILERIMNLDKLKSRKLWATVLGSALVTIGTEMGFPQDTVTGLVAILVAYLLGQGIADHGKSAIVALCAFLLIVPADAGETATPPPALEEEVDMWKATQVYGLINYSFDDDEFGAGIRLAYDINDHVRVRADYVSDFDNFASGEEFGADTNVSLALLYPVEAVPGLELYTITGLGVTDFENPDIELIAGVGIEYHIKEAWHSFIEFQHSSDKKENFMRFGIGVSF
ncbi:MAG: outer membrane beta-barrel protein [Ilumatobacteraceae bacterium]